jgi:hypothetical protein
VLESKVHEWRKLKLRVPNNNVTVRQNESAIFENAS